MPRQPRRGGSTRLPGPVRTGSTNGYRSSLSHFNKIKTMNQFLHGLILNEKATNTTPAHTQNNRGLSRRILSLKFYLIQPGGGASAPDPKISTGRRIGSNPLKIPSSRDGTATSSEA